MKSRFGRMDVLGGARAVPLTSPLYELRPPGWVYRNTVFTSVTFETNEDAVLDVLPDRMQPADTPPQVSLILLECEESSFGAYNELKFELAVEFNGEPYRYCPYIFVSAVEGCLAPDAAMAMGRELMGTPKKIAHISVQRHADQLVMTVERPLGTELLTLSMVPQHAISADALNTKVATPVLHLRHIPSVDGGPPSVAELVRWDTKRRITSEVRTGPASVVYAERAAEEGLSRLAANGVARGVTCKGDLTIPVTAQVLYDYLAPLAGAP